MQVCLILDTTSNNPLGSVCQYGPAFGACTSFFFLVSINSFCTFMQLRAKNGKAAPIEVLIVAFGALDFVLATEKEEGL